MSKYLITVSYVDEKQPLIRKKETFTQELENLGGLEDYAILSQIESSDRMRSIIRYNTTENLSIDFMMKLD
jgi:hypothetical protein